MPATETTPMAMPAFTPPPLPPTFAHTTPPPTLHYQGAEALLYRTTYLSEARPAALKHRPSKPYRHPILDAKLTRHRILAEARVLVKLRREAVSVPAVYGLDWDQGWMLSEWIAGSTVRSILDDRLPGFVDEEDIEDASVAQAERHAREREESAEDLVLLMRKIGQMVGKMHAAGVVHGDLTTSNLMVQPSAQQQQPVAEGTQSSAAGPQGALDEIVIIDFGLAAQSVQDEDRAVDLYVLERAFGSTHPRTEVLYQQVLQSYGGSYKAAKVVLKRLEEVRMRGRKKIMIG